MFRPNLKSVASHAPEIMSIGVLGGGCEDCECEPPILEKGRSYGVADGAVGKSVGKFL